MSNSFDHPELPAHGLIANLAEDDRRLLGNYGEFLPVQPGQTIIEQGGSQDSLYIVISGVLHVHADNEGKRTLVARIAAGESIGEINLFDPGTASASVTAMEFSQVWKANRHDLDDFVSSYPEAGIRLLSGLLTGMSQRLRHMNERLLAKEIEAAFQSFWT
jgi:CRP-like cAMP-binding protein